MPKTHDGETPVVFRSYSDDEIIALFPTLPGGRYGECMSYLHIGQHGAADYGHVIRRTRPATADEAFQLWEELIKVGYDDLKVYHREQPWMHDALRDAHEASRIAPVQ